MDARLYRVIRKRKRKAEPPDDELPERTETSRLHPDPIARNTLVIRTSLSRFPPPWYHMHPERRLDNNTEADEEPMLMCTW